MPVKGAVMQGTIKWYNSNKGYGFINAEDGNDYFAHVSNFIDAQNGARISADEGTAVDFEPGESEKGLLAYNIAFV